MQTSPFTLQSRLNSFRFAWRGIRRFFREEANARIHLVATAAVVLGLVFVPLTKSEMIALVIVTGMVWAAEAFNTVIERLIDFIHPGRHPQVGYIKDLAAGAVLITALTAFVTAAIIFLPKFF